jgi:hypothetical protein
VIRHPSPYLPSVPVDSVGELFVQRQAAVVLVCGPRIHHPRKLLHEPAGVVYGCLVLLGYEAVSGIPHPTRYLVLVIARAQDRTRQGW